MAAPASPSFYCRRRRWASPVIGVVEKSSAARGDVGGVGRNSEAHSANPRPSRRRRKRSRRRCGFPNRCRTRRRSRPSKSSLSALQVLTRLLETVLDDKTIASLKRSLDGVQDITRRMKSMLDEQTVAALKRSAPIPVDRSGAAVTGSISMTSPRKPTRTAPVRAGRTTAGGIGGKQKCRRLRFAPEPPHCSTAAVPATLDRQVAPEGAHPGRDGPRHPTMRHWITSFQLLTGSRWFNATAGRSASGHFARAR